MAWTKSELRKKIKQLKSKRTSFEDRRDAVQKAYNKCNGLDDYKEKIEKKITDCTGALMDGINRVTALADKCDIIEETADSELLRCRGTYESAMDEMNEEIDRCNDNIDSLNEDIRYYQNLMDSAED